MLARMWHWLYEVWLFLIDIVYSLCYCTAADKKKKYFQKLPISELDLARSCQLRNVQSCALNEKVHYFCTGSKTDLGILRAISWIDGESYTGGRPPPLLYEIGIWNLDWGQAMRILHGRRSVDFWVRLQRFGNRPAIRQIFKTIKA